MSSGANPRAWRQASAPAGRNTSKSTPHSTRKLRAGSAPSVAATARMSAESPVSASQLRRAARASRFLTTFSNGVTYTSSPHTVSTFGWKPL